MADKIEHQEKKNRFLLVEDGMEAELTYKRRGDTIIFDHTEVPEPLHIRAWQISWQKPPWPTLPSRT